MLNPADSRLKAAKAASDAKMAKAEQVQAPRHIAQVASSLFFKYNQSLGPPYHVLVDTNFINFSLQNKLEMVKVCTAFFLNLVSSPSYLFFLFAPSLKLPAALFPLFYPSSSFSLLLLLVF